MEREKNWKQWQETELRASFSHMIPRKLAGWRQSRNYQENQRFHIAELFIHT